MNLLSTVNTRYYCKRLVRWWNIQNIYTVNVVLLEGSQFLMKNLKNEVFNLHSSLFTYHYIIAEWPDFLNTSYHCWMTYKSSKWSSRVKGIITPIWQNVKRSMDMHIWNQIHLTNSWLKSSVMTGGHSCGHSILIQWSFCVVLYIEQNFLKPLLKLEPCCFVLHFLEMIIVRHNANAQHVPLILY